MMDFNNDQSKEKKILDKLIKKSRTHFYKPIQVAEILYRDRIKKDISLNNLESYRTKSKKWRDEVSLLLVGRKCSSSSKFQDNLFENNAIPPKILDRLGEVNRKNIGSVEKYIYSKFFLNFGDLNSGLKYCNENKPEDFYLKEFLDLFTQVPGLKRSLDKVYEIIVYSLFSSLVEAMEIEINISIKNKDNPILKEFSGFSSKILGFDKSKYKEKYPAKLFRLGVTNAADRGLDMWGNFGSAIQIKHLSLSEDMAQSVVDSIVADRIIIVCKDAEEKIIVSLLSQIGWKSKIQSIITFKELITWYDKACRGSFSNLLGKKLISSIKEQIMIEFPSLNESNALNAFFEKRGY